MMRAFGYFALTILMVLLTLWVSTTSELQVFDGLTTILAVLIGLFWLSILISIVTSAKAKRRQSSFWLLPILFFMYLLGWQATEINLYKFFAEFSDTFRIFNRILWPWDAAFEREQEVAVAQSEFITPCPTTSAPAQAQSQKELWISVEPGCGALSEYIVGEGFKPGATLTVQGWGFMPNAVVEIWWRDPIGAEFKPFVAGKTISVMSDAQGEFSIAFTAPQYLTPRQAEGVQVHYVQARQVISIGRVKISEDFRLAIDRMIVTIFQALMATSLGIIFATPLSFLAARNLMYETRFTRAIYYTIRFLLNITRSIEPVIWAVIAVVWVGLGPFAGVLALLVHTIASLGKLYSEAVENVNPEPIEAVTATGATRLQTIVYAIIPQTMPLFLSYTIYRWDINVRMSTIVGFVGGGGLGQILFQWINQSRWSAAGLAVWLIIITVGAMDYLSAELRKRLV